MSHSHDKLKYMYLKFAVHIHIRLIDMFDNYVLFHPPPYIHYAKYTVYTSPTAQTVLKGYT